MRMAVKLRSFKLLVVDKMTPRSHRWAGWPSVPRHHGAHTRRTIGQLAEREGVIADELLGDAAAQGRHCIALHQDPRRREKWGTKGNAPCEVVICEPIVN